LSYAPYDYNCPYKNSCPHLEWLSTTWVLESYQRAEDTYEEHLRIVDNFYNSNEELRRRVRELEKENAEIKARLKQVHQRQFKPNKKTKEEQTEEKGSSNPGKEKKKRGAPVGHPGWGRHKPERIDRTVHVPAPSVCPHCQKDNLNPYSGIYEHVQEDIVIKPKTVVIKYLHEQSFCSRCNRPVIQAGEGELLNAHIGPVAKSVALYLRYHIGISYRKSAELFRGLFGLDFVPASAFGFDKNAASRGFPIYDDLREKIRASDIAHADETSWRNDGIGHYVWFAGNEDLAYFHIDRHRSSEVAKSIFGDNYEGILIRDRYAAYNGIGREWQACLAHIRKNAKEIRQEHDLLPQEIRDSATDRFCERIISLCSEACKTGSDLNQNIIPWEAASDIEKQFIEKLFKICRKSLSFKPAETLRAFLTGTERRSLFTFLRHKGVQPTNNHAEQSLRHMVIFRKLSFGTRSHTGIKTHSILPSLLQTARRQGASPINFFHTLFTSNTQTAKAALYRNSS
jgi:transposase